MPKIPQDAIKYTLGALSGFAALLLLRMLDPAFGTNYPYLTVWLAVTFSAWYCGIGPSILALAIDMAGVWYWFLPPYDSFSAKSYPEFLGMLSFVVFSAVLIALGESNRHTILQHKRAQEELRVAHLELEVRVKDRTAALEERTAALERAENAARSLSGRILTLQDDERRRIARGLHDSLGQYLAALKMCLARLPAALDEQIIVASECSDIAEKCLTETRTISHLLHPPLLEESGFCSAAQWYVDGFAQRSGIAVKCDLPQNGIRLHSDVEIALFRAVQEALTNVHRHSGASLVTIRLTLDREQVRLEVRDNGRGIPQNRLKSLHEGAAALGVGLAGIRERVRELGGSLEVHSDGRGTSLIVSTPRIDRIVAEPGTMSASRSVRSSHFQSDPRIADSVARVVG